MSKTYWVGPTRWLTGTMAAAIFFAAPTAEPQVKVRNVDERGRTIISDQPWQPGKVIYGTDDRIDIFEETDPLRLQLADATCALMGASDLTNNGNGTFTILTGNYSIGGFPACPGEPYGNQPTAAFCTGFLVGDDLIATAGHCYDSTDLSSVRFVFGFEMLDSSTPRTVVNASEVYQGVEVVGRQLTATHDYAIVRVDRDVTAPGAAPLEIRRSGVIPNGTAIGVIGHPAGLPKKIAFGPTTAVADNSPTGFFIANLDTYGGNSGSPVFNAATGVVEGILVRGAQDYVLQSTCFVSNQLSDGSAGTSAGEDSSKTTTFMQFIPELVTSAGEVSFSQLAYPCAGTAMIELVDADLNGTATVTVTSSGGDSETVVLSETSSGSGRFEGTLPINTAGVSVENGSLNVAAGQLITASYNDADDGTGSPDVVTDTADIDCTPPAITSLIQGALTGVSLQVLVGANEPVSVTIRYGSTCDNLLQAASSSVLSTSHSILLSGLSPTTMYFFEVELEDAAGNTAVDDSGGGCYTFATSESVSYLTEEFLSSGNVDLDNTSLRFTPNGSADFYALCATSATGFPTDPTGGNLIGLSDDDSAQITLSGGKTVSLYGTNYGTFYVGSNGYITFTAPDTEFAPSVSHHFSQPRISVLFDDFDPSAGGTISWKQLSDRVAVTYQDVPEFAAFNSSSFQVEMFFSGIIQITHLDVDTVSGVVGLASGFGGVPADFLEDDLSNAGECVAVPNAITSNIPQGFVEEGDRLVLTAPSGAGYQWKKNGVDLVDDAPVLMGAFDRQLIFEPVNTSHNGAYTVMYDDGTKALLETPPFFLSALAPGSVPAATTAGLLGLAAGLAVGAWWRRRRA